MIARPWQERANELQAMHGPFCDFVAWEEWMRRTEEQECPDADFFGNLELLDRIVLYHIMVVAQS